MKKAWSDDSLEGLKAPISKGQRLIIVHAGGEEGFIPNALLIFKSGTKSGDYHDEMNHQNFRKWLETQLIPNLPQNCVVVMDNASYHNIKSTKEPTSTTLKKAMIEWLCARNVECDEALTKPELYNLIKPLKEKEQVFVIDAVLAAHGHVTLRLPPYHPELNPIEKIWALVKNWVAAHNVTFKLGDVENLARQKFSEATQADWKSVCDHVKKVEMDYIEREHLLDEVFEMIFPVNTGESDEEDDRFDSDESDSDLGVYPLSD